MSGKSLKNKILKERGVTSARDVASQRKRTALSKQRNTLGFNKTPLMMYLEQKYLDDIVSLISNGSLGYAESKLGYEVDRTTISKWRKLIKDSKKGESNARDKQ